MHLPDTTIAPPPTPPPIVVDELNCTFEEDFCNFTQEIWDDQMDWGRWQGYGPGSLQEYGEGPYWDHTTGTIHGKMPR